MKDEEQKILHQRWNDAEKDEPTQYRKCSLCLFFDDTGGATHGADILGLCRRNPPRIAPTLNQLTAAWPSVTGKDWCGEWAACFPAEDWD